MMRDVVELMKFFIGGSLAQSMFLVGLLVALYGGAHILTNNPKLKGLTMKTGVITGLALMVLATIIFAYPRLDPAEGQSLDPKTGGGRVYVRFTPSALTVADGFLQIQMKGERYGGGENPCGSDKVVLGETHPYIPHYLLLAQQALIHNKELSVGLSGDCLTDHKWNLLETLILVR